MSNVPKGLRWRKDGKGLECVHGCGTWYDIRPTEKELETHYCPPQIEKKRLAMQPFPFKIRSKVRAIAWTDPNQYVTVTAIGENHWLGVASGYNKEHSYLIASPWVEYVPPPVRRRWTFETEQRDPQSGEQYLCEGKVYYGWPQLLKGLPQTIVGEITEVNEMPQVPE